MNTSHVVFKLTALFAIRKYRRDILHDVCTAKRMGLACRQGYHELLGSHPVSVQSSLISTISSPEDVETEAHSRQAAASSQSES